MVSSVVEFLVLMHNNRYCGSCLWLEMFVLLFEVLLSPEDFDG